LVWKPVFSLFAALVVLIVVSGFRQNSGRDMAGFRYPFGILIAVFSAFWLFDAIGGVLQLNFADPRAWLVLLMCSLVVVGLGGLLGFLLSALGPLCLPPSYEWPAGFVRGVVTADNGKHIVPLVPSGRVQIYDPQWHFICGWNVDAWGGNFEVHCPSDGMVEVRTARGDRCYSFTEEGRLISSKPDPEPVSHFWPSNGRSVWVPTAPLRWIFSSPLLCGAVATAGFAGLVSLGKVAL
jgi:hypothetical protein